MAEYNPSKIIKDGNTYNFRDTTKIPLSGSNQISGSLIPVTTDAYDLGGSSYQWNNAYIKSLTINGVACGDILTHNASEFVPKSGGAVISGVELYRTADDSKLIFGGATTGSNGASIELYGKNHSSFGGWTVITPRDSNGYYQMILKPDGTATWGGKNLAMQEDTIPRSGGAVIIGNTLGRIDDTGTLFLNSGPGENNGGHIVLFGASYTWWESGRGVVRLNPALSSTTYKSMYLYPDGTWTWDGTACQITSDQRFKQQISQIDDDLLDAWEDVNLVQFKYNDAVKEKSDNARLHTGYVVQQIDDACKSHGVDVSKYGLYCHEEYAEETREVEHEDGTKTVEVVRPASEHYSLRYTEALIVECAYLRKCIKELRNEIEELKSSK